MENLNVLKGRRLKILRILGADWKGKVAVVNTRQRLNVTQIMIKVRDVSQSLISQNLKSLRDAGVVQTERVGKEIFYSLSENFEERMRDIDAPAIAILKHRALKKGKNRKKVVKFLTENPGAQVKDICPELERSVVSQELAILRKSGVAMFREEGRKRFYSLC